MTREDLGLIRDMADRQLNLRLTRVIDEIRSAMRAYRLVDDEREGHPHFSPQEREILGLLISDSPFENWPGWVSVKALESFVCSLIPSTKDRDLLADTVFVPSGSVKVKVNLEWASAEGYVDRTLGFGRVFFLSVDRRDTNSELTQAQWKALKDAMLAEEAKS